VNAVQIAGAGQFPCNQARKEFFHYKLKEKGVDGRIQFLQDYLDYLIRKNTTLPPDFPTFCREIVGLDDRSGWIHITVWHQDSELKQFAQDKGYECRVEHYD
jgi:hypothetical protein